MDRNVIRVKGSQLNLETRRKSPVKQTSQQFVKQNLAPSGKPKVNVPKLKTKANAPKLKTKAKGNFSKKKLYQGLGILVVFSILLGLIIYFTTNSGSTDVVETFTWPSRTLASTTTKPDLSEKVEPVFNDTYWLSVRGECGNPQIQPELISTRIVGGTEAKKNSWPWQIALVKYKDYGDGLASVTHLCGGTLVGPQYVITAAHCFLNKYRTQVTTNPRDYRVIVGAHAKAAVKDGASLSRISKVFHHPSNNLAVFGRLGQAPMYDITVLKLATSYSPQDNQPIVNFACLPNPQHLPTPGERCWSSGWGKTRGTGFETVLKQVPSPVVSKDRCDSFWPKKISYEVHLCTEQPSAGTCEGDSGGPLVCQGADERWTLYGATSFGPTPCAISPNAFASVSFFMEWVCCHLDKYGPCSAVPCSIPD